MKGFRYFLFNELQRLEKIRLNIVLSINFPRENSSRHHRSGLVPRDAAAESLIPPTREEQRGAEKRAENPAIVSTSPQYG